MRSGFKTNKNENNFSVYPYFNYQLLAVNYEPVFEYNQKSVGNLPVETIFQEFLPQNDFRTSGPYTYKDQDIKNENKHIKRTIK